MKTDESERRAFLEAEVFTSLAHQIRALRINRGLTQKELASRMGTQQSSVARMEDPSSGSFSSALLLKAAEALEVGLHVRFVSLTCMLLEADQPKKFHAPKCFSSEANAKTLSDIYQSENALIGDTPQITGPDGSSTGAINGHPYAEEANKEYSYSY